MNTPLLPGETMLANTYLVQGVVELPPPFLKSRFYKLCEHNPSKYRILACLDFRLYKSTV